MPEETVGRLVRRLRNARGLTQGQLATYANVPRSWLSLLELDRIAQPDRDRLEQLAVVLGVRREVLWGAAGYRTEPMPPPAARKPDEILRELQAAMREAPILAPETTQAVSAGPGAPAEAEYWPYYPTPEERGHEFVAVKVSGTCMEPRIREGDRVIVDKTATPRDGDIVVALHEGELLVKQLEKRNGDYYLVALQDQPPIKVNGETRIIGVVRMAMYRP